MRGIPETADTDQIITALQRVFNSLLERQEEAEIEFVRAHRAFRMRGPDSAPPRDIICCLQNFTLKEDIIREARRNDRIILNGETIMLIQNLFPITLKNRRALHPLLDKLREKELRYTLSASLFLQLSHTWVSNISYVLQQNSQIFAKP